MIEKLTERDKFFYAVIEELNKDEDRHGRGGLFYGGELGCCLVWYSRQGLWERKWYELEYPPFAVGGTVGYTVTEKEGNMKDKFFARDQVNRMPWKVIVNGAVKAEFYDKEQAERYIKNNNLDWTAEIKEVNGEILCGCQE